MRVTSGRFVSKSEYRNRVIRDVIIVAILFGTLFLLYVEVKNPFPIRFIFKSVLQDVKTSLLEEYSNIYYPTYYFSLQMTPVFEVINEAPDAYRILITNFFPKHPFIEEAAMKIDDNYINVHKEATGYKVTEQVVKNDSGKSILDEYDYLPYEQLTLDSFYVQDGHLYINLVYIANENVAFSYNAKFNINLADSNISGIKDVYAYVAAGNNLVAFPVSDISKPVPEDYIQIISELRNSFTDSKNDMANLQYKDKSYWGYKGTFTVAGNVNEVGIIVPEHSLTTKIRLPIILFFIIAGVFSVAIVVMLAIHYIHMIEDIRREHTNIKHLIEEGENTHLEFKTTLRYDTQTCKVNKALEEVVIKSIAAFSNTEGGRLVIGIKNEGEILGLENDYSTLKQPNKDFFELHLRTLVETAYGNAFSAEGLRIDFINENGKDVCIVNIREGREPVYTKIVNKQGLHEEKFYIRVGNSSREIANASEIIAYVKKHFK